MNEKIKALKEQAIIEKQWDVDNGRWIDRHVSLDLFAELIISECANVADLADANKCEWIGGNILTHFGVEE